MVLESFNVFGQIEFAEKEIKISATAFNEKRPVNFSFKFKARVDTQGENTSPIQFATLLKHGETLLVRTRNRASISNDVQKSLGKFLSMLENEINNLESESENIDKAVEMTERGMSEDEIEIALGMKISTDSTQRLRQASKKAEVYSIAKDIMIYTEDGYVFVDLNTAYGISEDLPICIKKASKGITDKETSTWLMKTFSKKR